MLDIVWDIVDLFVLFPMLLPLIIERLAVGSMGSIMVQLTPDLVNVDIVNSLDLVNFSLLTDFL